MKSPFKDILARGHLIAAISKEIPGFSTCHEGYRSGFDIDIVRALAAALFGNQDAVSFVEVTPGDRISAIEDGRCDLGAFNLSANFERLNSHAIQSPMVSFFDGESALIRIGETAPLLTALRAPLIAVQEGTTTPGNLERFLAKDNDYRLAAFASHEEALQALQHQDVDAYVLDSSMLYTSLAGMETPEHFCVTGEQISFEPLSPIVHRNNHELNTALFWTLQVLLQAERNGHRQCSIRTTVSELERLKSLTVYQGTETILKPGFYHRIIEAVGNYEELFTRNLGSQSGFNVNRGLNSLIEDGGIFAPLTI